MIPEPFWRYRIEVEFDGEPFAGWQRQDNAPSVQAAIEDAALAFAPGAVHCYGAGRTDAGVHALAMTAHLDIQKQMDPFKVESALNALLRPLPIAILSATEVSHDFHARFGAKERSYLYRFACRRSPLALEKGRAWQVPHTLDTAAMAEAARHLEGLHDFTTFRSAHCQSKDPVKTLTEIIVRETEEGVALDLRAPSFLHNQVRSIAGTLERVGAGRWTPLDVKSALEAKDRSRCAPVAPAHGLYFVRARY